MNRQTRNLQHGHKLPKQSAAAVDSDHHISAYREDRKRLGAFYTPDAIAKVLVRWAIQDKVATVLDPSFGGGVFLRAAVDSLSAAGAVDPGRLVYGVDVDQKTIQLVHDDGIPVARKNLFVADFLSLNPDSLPTRLGAVVGNPPYVRHHWMGNNARGFGREVVAMSGCSLSRRASIWAYFVVHAPQFIAPGGRLAFVLPQAFLYADYVDAVLAYLKTTFRAIDLVAVDQRLFAEAEEGTVVLLASGRGEGNGVVHFHRSKDVREVETLVDAGLQNAGELTDRWEWRTKDLSDNEMSAWTTLLANDSVRLLSDVAQIRIGVVTGANHFFVRNRTVRRTLSGTGVRTLPIVSRGQWLKHAIWTRADHEARIEADEQALLMHIVRKNVRKRAVARLIADGEAQKLTLRRKCRQRSFWYCIEDTKRPDAFLRYMSHLPPAVTLNQSTATCTNAIHRLWWRDKSLQNAIAIGSWTTLFALGAELLGRSYGGGVLKLEIHEARALPVPIVESAASQIVLIDTLARAGDMERARNIADQAVLRKGLGVRDSDVAAMRSALVTLQGRRAGFAKL